MEIEEIYLETRAIFLAAQQFYKKKGFKEISKGNLPDSFPLTQITHLALEEFGELNPAIDIFLPSGKLATNSSLAPIEDK